MYNNAGKQIKNLVATIAIIEVIACVIIGIIVMCVGYDLWWIGLIIIVAGVFSAWIGYLFLYAYGELVDKTYCIERFLYTNSTKQNIIDTNNKTAGPNEWKCSKCGIINQNYVGTCACGQENQDGAVAVNPTDDFLNKIKNIPAVKEQTRISIGESFSPEPQSVASSAVPYRLAGPNEWQCSKCGVINQNYVGTCGCGQTKAEN